MATNTAATSARQNAAQETHYLRQRITFDGSLTGEMPNPLPDGAIIVRGSVYVWTAFNDGTANTINIGIDGEADRYMSAGSLASAANVSFDDLANANMLVSGDQTVTYAITQTGGDATAGKADIVIEYIPDNDH